MPRRAATPYRSPAASRPQAESFPEWPPGGAARLRGPRAPGASRWRACRPRLGRRGFRSVCLPRTPPCGPPHHPRPRRGESGSCHPLRRDASDFSPRTPGGATRGRLGRLSRISEVTRLVQLKSVPEMLLLESQPLDTWGPVSNPAVSSLSP